MFKASFKYVLAGVLALVVIPVQAAVVTGGGTPGPRGGIFGGPKNYTLKADIVQCVNKDPFFGESIPDDLADLAPMDSHPACGNLKARILAHIDLPLQHKRTQLWNNLKTVAITGKRFAHALDEDKGFEFSLIDKPVTTIRTGIELEAYLDASDRNEPTVSILIKHYSADNTSEEMVIKSSGEVYLNPYPREVVRMVHIHTKVTPDREDIWGGEGVYVGVAPKDIPHAFPENARLWLSGSIQK
ncbi:MAG: hypothetical protein CMF62_09955 [Magnetococcales bacterium]|nr:hypothetical protein [Magnetococcales bacterium]